jgi:hypothetical protein
VSSVRVRARLSAGNYTGGNWYCEITIPSSTTAGDYAVTAEVSGIGNSNLGSIKVVAEAVAEWTPPADSTASLNDSDDTYNRICVSLGWTECGIWTIYNANGLQMNRVVGPYPLSKLVALGCQNSRVNLCGGEPKGFAVLEGLYSRTSTTSASRGSTGSTSSSPSGATETSVATSPASSATQSPSQPTPNTTAPDTRVVTASTETSVVTAPAIAGSGTVVTTPQVASTPQAPVPISSRPAPEIDSDGIEEAPAGNLSVRQLSNGRFRLVVTTNLDSEAITIRATKKGARSVRFQAAVDEEGRVVINTTRNLEGYRLSLIFEETTLATTKVG